MRNKLCGIHQAFSMGKIGRGGWMALKNQYTGVDKWQAEINGWDNLIYTCVWKGQSNFTLEPFIAQHRNIFLQYNSVQFI